jgi:acyl-CoA synthetase (AMP-forming)/AMP-acid ligase II
MAVIAAGGSVSILDRWTPEAALAMIESDRIDFWWTQTTMLLLATQSDAWHTTDLSSVRTIGFAGAPVQDCMLRSLEAVGAQLVTGYGMTEVHGNVTYTDADADHEELLETVGRPDEEFRVLVVDDEGSEVAPGEVGEIVIDAPTMVVGYWYGPGDVRSVRERDGWYHTNDLARRRADGNLELVGRKDHMYKSGGFNVFPREVELAIEEHPDVAAAVVIGVPDARWGHVGTAFIRRATKNLTEDEIREHAQSRLANYKVPKRIVVCDDFPMLASGKVDRVALGKL